MKGFFALVRRDLFERRLAFQAAALAALIPFLVPVVRGLRGLEAREARESTAVLLAMAFAAVLSAALGWTALNRDLADRRIAFYFSRPLPEVAIASGRLASAFLIAVGTAAILWLPCLIVSRGQTVLTHLPNWTPWAVLGGSAVLVLLFNAAGLVLRSRSSLLALDAAMILLAGIACLWASERLLRRVAFVPTRRGLAAAAGILVLGLFVGALAALRRGRVDIRAAHRAFSLRLWASLGIAAAAFAAYSAWVLSAGPQDLLLVGASPAPRGNWVAVNGEARGASAGFLLDAKSGAYRAAGAPWGFQDWSGWFGPSFSNDGRTAAWFEAKGREGPYELVVLPLDDPAARPRPTGYTVVSVPHELVLSADGSRFATISSGGVSVADVASGRLLASARVADEGTTVFGGFIDRNLFRAYGWARTRLDISELDVARRTLRRTATISGLEGTYTFCVDTSGERLLVREHGGTRLSLFDGKSGSRLAVLAEGPRQASSWAAFLSDGRAVFATSGDSGARLRVFAADGAPLRSIELPSTPRILLGAEAEPGKIVVGATDNSFWEGAASYLVDADGGGARKIADDLTPVSWSYIPVRPVPAGSEAAKLFYGPGRSLVRLDPLTGERRVVLEGRR